MSDPRVTVLMPVKDAEPYLAEAVDSILAQTFRDFRLLAIDDGSTDGSAATLERYARDDQRVQVVRNERNEGLARTLAKGVELAQTELVARMDPDDVAVPERLERQVRYLADHPEVDVLGTWATDIDEKGNALRPRRAPLDHGAIVSALIFANPMIHPTVMFRRVVVLRAGSYDTSVRVAEDYNLWFRCVAAGARFANLGESLLWYRAPEAGVMRKAARFGLDGMKTRWTGYRVMGVPWWRRGLGLLIPLSLGLVPPVLRRRAYALALRWDPRQRTRSD